MRMVVINQNQAKLITKEHTLPFTYNIHYEITTKEEGLFLYYEGNGVYIRELDKVVVELHFVKYNKKHSLFGFGYDLAEAFNKQWRYHTVVTDDFTVENYRAPKKFQRQKLTKKTMRRRNGTGKTKR